MKTYAYKCLECNAINISKYDGHSCGKCNGAITPIGEAIMLDSAKKNTDCKLDKIYQVVCDIEKAYGMMRYEIMSDKR